MLTLCLQINMRVSYKFVLLLLAGVTIHTQGTPSSKFVMPLWYFKKVGRVNIIFLHEDKHQIFPQAGCIAFIIKVTYIMYYAHASLWYLRNISKNNGGMKLLFCMQINIKLSYKPIPLILVGMARPTLITRSNKFSKSL